MKYTGPIFIPPDLYRLTSKEFRDALMQYNAKAPKTPPKTPIRQANAHDQAPHPSHEPPAMDHGEPNQTSEDAKPSVSFGEPDLEPPPNTLQDMMMGRPIDENNIDYQQEYQHHRWEMGFHSTYHVFKTKATPIGTLIDRGANGGLAGADVKVLSRTGRKVTISGIDNHELVGLDIVSCAAKVKSNKGPIILILNEYAYCGRGTSIHSCNQVEHYKHLVDDRAVPNGGKQLIFLHDGFVLPLVCDNSLMYLQFLEKPTSQDMDKYPHVIFTSPHMWDPSKLNYTHPNPYDWDLPLNMDIDHRVNDYGEYMNRIIMVLDILLSDDEPFNIRSINISTRLYHLT